jgi:hypothetical protein
VTGVRKPVARAGLLLVPCCRSEPFGHSQRILVLTVRSCCSPSASNCAYANNG